MADRPAAGNNAAPSSAPPSGHNAASSSAPESAA